MIIIGSYNSVKFMFREKLMKTDDQEAIIESVGMSEAYKFPIIGSLMLFTLYVLVKFAGKEIVSLFLIGYFMLIGMESFKGIINNYTWVGQQREDDPKSVKYPIFFKDFKPMGVDLSLSKFDIVCLVLSATCAIFYAVTRHWVTNNIMATIFTLFALENMFLESFQVGSIMLIGLFFYDVFWVFGTDVMETVAKSIDGPIKLLFPKVLDVQSNDDMSLLGLGDIIIPGIFVALCLRYDFLRNFKAGKKAKSIAELDTIFKNISKPYFWSCIAGYVVGILTTVVVMLVFKRGQPALLYLVPGCIGSVFLCAFVRHEIKDVFNYSEEEEFKKH